MKIVINSCYGGFGLSSKALLWLFEHGYNKNGFKIPVNEYFGKTDDDNILGLKSAMNRWKKYLKNPNIKSLFITTFTPDEKYVLSGDSIPRNESLLIRCVEELGEDAGGRCSDLKIVEIPDNIDYVIDEYDGLEHIAEKHRTWS